MQAAICAHQVLPPALSMGTALSVCRHVVEDLIFMGKGIHRRSRRSQGVRALFLQFDEARSNQSGTFAFYLFFCPLYVLLLSWSCCYVLLRLCQESGTEEARLYLTSEDKKRDTLLRQQQYVNIVLWEWSVISITLVPYRRCQITIPDK